MYAEDPTRIGSIWNSARSYLGKTANVGFTLPLRGPGGASPPAAGEWLPGRVFQAGGWAEVVTAAPITGTAQAGGSTTTAVLAAPASAVADAYFGMPIQPANVGTVRPVKSTSMTMAYDGTTQTTGRGNVRTPATKSHI